LDILVISVSGEAFIDVCILRCDYDILTRQLRDELTLFLKLENAN